MSTKTIPVKTLVEISLTPFGSKQLKSLILSKHAKRISVLENLGRSLSQTEKEELEQARWEHNAAFRLPDECFSEHRVIVDNVSGTEELSSLSLAMKLLGFNSSKNPACLGSKYVSRYSTHKHAQI